MRGCQLWRRPFLFLSSFLLLVSLLALGQGGPSLPLELPTIGELAGFNAPPRALSLRAIGAGRLGALPVPERLGSEQAGKLEPLLRIILERDREATAQGAALDLAAFAPLAAVYAEEGPLFQSAVPTALGEFRAPPPRTPPAARAEKLAVLIRARSRAGLAASGAEILAASGEITVAKVTPAQLRRLAQNPDVIYIEAAHRLAPELDRSVPAIGADRLWQEEPALRGKGVLIGVIDTGIDYEHLDFRADADGDGFEESSRIAYLWDQTETGPWGNPGAVPFGTEYTKAEIEAELARPAPPEARRVHQRDEVGHGTHVAGIAAGDGSSSTAGYVGVAPEAELIVVKTSFFTSDVVAGVDYIFRRAAEMGRPCVVNLSLGGHFGPHDGTSNFDLALEALLGPGRVIVTSAGNEGDEPIHIAGKLAYPGSSAQFTFVPAEETVYLDIWHPGGAEFEIELGAPVAGNLVQVVAAEPGEMVVRETAAGRVSIDNASGGADPNNGDKEIGVLLEEVAVGQPWTIRLIARAGSGRFDGWPGLASMGAFLQGDSGMTISEPGNGRGIVTVGAWTTRVEWQSLNGNEYHFRGASGVGELAPFSSRGPTRDGRRKPDLAAPGTAIIAPLAAGSELSAVEELIATDRAHAAYQGTSMAAPHVAGTVALMLQAHSGVAPAEAAEKLRQTAVRDSLTGASPSELWGSGKLNAERGVSLLGLALPQAGGQPEVKAGSNPASERVLFTYALPPGTREARLIVFSVVGQPVFSAPLDPQGDRFTWDLSSSEGKPLANGLYIYLVLADGVRSAIHRLVIRR
ncbi:MAG: S8 family peptidase [Candidatus Acetothermia bacterium]|jgi:subtilisin family serine protease|nr:S8 family peptidase [Candidatus Acetothermia bacterium]MDH7505598.1 S8 family peptidase [Candidatus Acetothermia bacterium]